MDDVKPRRRQAQQAARISWERTADRTARTEHGRRGLQAKIIRDLITEIGQDAWDAATPAQQEEWAGAARAEHFAGLARARHHAAADRRFEEMRSKLRDSLAGPTSA